MKTRKIDVNNLLHTEDWVGNNLAVTCPVCGKVYIVSGLLHPHWRECPGCGKSKSFIKKESRQEGKALIQWER